MGVLRLLSLRILIVAGLIAPLIDAGAALVSPGGKAMAQAVGPNKSGLPLPRFVSLKSSRVNLRIGPGRTYPVDWMYMKSGLPMEVIQEYDNWRRVRDSEGTEGWINQSLLSGKRTAIAAPWNKGKEVDVKLVGKPADDASLVASVEPGSVGTIERCDGGWCQMRFGRYSGWVSQSQIWGAYPDEKFDD